MSRDKRFEQPEQNILLHTKLTPPLPRSCVLARPRLITRLEEDLSGCVTVLSAPAGFGKTTLVAEWAAQRANRVAWLSLDEGDNELGRFWRYVVAALQTVTDNDGQPTFSESARFTLDNWERMLMLFINGITAAASVTDPIILVLDDYHLIHTNTIHQSLSFLLHHQPHPLHVVILSRADPPLALARLRVQGRLWELRAADLRFTTEEMKAFFNCTLTVSLSTTAFKTLSERIEGWAAGLQLAVLSLRGLSAAEVESFVRTFSGAQRYVLNYLLEEVLLQQSPRIQTFLLQTSVLRTLTPALCQAVTGYEDSRDILKRLAEENLFILPLDEAGQWYRYHRLFAGALRSRLEQTDPDLIPELRRRASDWYIEQSLGDGVPNHLLQVESLSDTWSDQPVVEPLTEREWEILMLISQGLSNQQIADRLVISVGTVKGHINHLLSKLDANSRTEAVAKAQRYGFLKP